VICSSGRAAIDDYGGGSERLFTTVPFLTTAALRPPVFLAGALPRPSTFLADTLFGPATPLITAIALLKSPIVTATIFALPISTRVDSSRFIVISSAIWHVHILLVYGYYTLCAPVAQAQTQRAFYYKCLEVTYGRLGLARSA
jgi:hypothetical protein